MSMRENKRGRKRETEGEEKTLKTKIKSQKYYCETFIFSI